jgi:hypothetical protein
MGFLLLLAQLATPALSGACTIAVPACTEWVQVGGGSGRSLIYRTHSLDKKNDRIKTALIMVHGTNRNADHYFQTAAAGLTQRTAGYTKGMTDEQLKKQLVSRPTTYLLSQVDTLPLGGFDSSCTAMAQGATRRARGEAYARFVTERLGAKHAIAIVSECGHNDRCVYTTTEVLPVIFPKK